MLTEAVLPTKVMAFIALAVDILVVCELCVRFPGIEESLMEVRYELDLEDVERMYPLIMSLLAAPHSSLRSMVAELGICLHEPLDQCRMLDCLDRWI